MLLHSSFATVTFNSSSYCVVIFNVKIKQKGHIDTKPPTFPTSCNIYDNFHILTAIKKEDKLCVCSLLKSQLYCVSPYMSGNQQDVRSFLIVFPIYLFIYLFQND